MPLKGIYFCENRNSQENSFGTNYSESLFYMNNTVNRIGFTPDEQKGLPLYSLITEQYIR